MPSRPRSPRSIASACAVHETLDPVATAFVLANEARRIIGCDRVSVLVKRRRKLVLEAVSGQESVERRASAVQLIEALVRVVAKAGEPLSRIPIRAANCRRRSRRSWSSMWMNPMPRRWPSCRCSSRGRRTVVKQGVDAVAVAKAEAAPRQAGEPVGALVAEWFSSRSFDGGKRARVELVAEHGQIALANALFPCLAALLFGAQSLGKSRVLTEARNLPKTVLAAAAAVAAVAGLI